LKVGNPSGWNTVNSSNSANLQNRNDNGVSITEAAKVMKVGPRSVASARKVQASGTPKLQEAVSQGKMKVSEAVKHVAKPAAT
jgi:hypothetical protein